MELVKVKLDGVNREYIKKVDCIFLDSYFVIINYLLRNKKININRKDINKYCLNGLYKFFKEISIYPPDVDDTVINILALNILNKVSEKEIIRIIKVIKKQRKSKYGYSVWISNHNKLKERKEIFDEIVNINVKIFYNTLKNDSIKRMVPIAKLKREICKLNIDHAKSSYYPNSYFIKIVNILERITSSAQRKKKKEEFIGQINEILINSNPDDLIIMHSSGKYGYYSIEFYEKLNNIFKK